MTKQEFLRILRGRITGAMDQSEVESQISYYSEYIDGLIAGGKTEEEAVAELGDPLLIAKTLGNAVEGGYIDSDYQGGSQAKEYREESYTSDAENRGGNSGYGSPFGQGSPFGNGNPFAGGGQAGGGQSTGGSYSSRNTNDAYVGNDFKSKAKGTWNKVKPVVIMVVGALVVLACIYLFFRACFTVGGCFFASFFPIIIIFIVVGLIFSFFRRR